MGLGFNPLSLEQGCKANTSTECTTRGTESHSKAPESHSPVESVAKVEVETEQTTRGTVIEIDGRVWHLLKV